ncbi:hypothetical protein CPB86DRAFT_733184 [Serendipita vermifera]|nr:hypothetical protein CPB86DRAFT_733184 [Serendipita vermifera]
MSSLLRIVEACDNFRIASSSEILSPFYIHVPPKPGDAIIGLLRVSVLDALEKYNTALITDGLAPIWNIVSFSRDDSQFGWLRSSLPETIGSKMVGFAASLDTPDSRSEAMRSMCEKWHHDGDPFGDIVGGRMWRDELYPIYKHPFILDEKQVAFSMERAATPLFGVVTYGVHMTMYTEDYRVWVPRRAKTKQTFGGMLDNTVAGGIPYGYTAYDSMVKECTEEAGLREEVVIPLIKSAGAVSYYYQTRKGWLQPEVEYVYDLLVPPGKETSPEFTPIPYDGEAESFELLSLDTVREKMLAGEFKPNCAVVMLDFMIRHGKVDASNEPQLLEILARLHGSFGYTN